MPSTPSFRRLLLLNAPEWKQALLGCSGALAFGAVQPVYSFFSRAMLSVFFVKDHDEIKSKVGEYCLIFVGLGLISFLVNVLQHCNFVAMWEYLTKRVREQMMPTSLLLRLDGSIRTIILAELFAPDL